MRPRAIMILKHLVDGLVEQGKPSGGSVHTFPVECYVGSSTTFNTP